MAQRQVALRCRLLARQCDNRADLFGRECRPGAPATFTPEQICAIVALACEQPAAESDLPLSHWSRGKLARCAVERGIVERISHSSVGRFFENKPRFGRTACGG